MLTEKEKKYLDDLILNDLLEGEDFLEITPEGIDKLKEYTLQKGIIDRIGWEQYTWNMRKILKYQYETDAPLFTILKTALNIVSIYGKEKSETYGIDCCILQYLIIGESYGYDVILNDPNFFNEVNRSRDVNKAIHSLNFFLSLYAEGDLDGSDRDYITLMKEIFEKIGYEEGYNFYKIANKNSKGLYFSISYLLWNNGFGLTYHQKKSLYNPRNFSYTYHPYLKGNMSLEQVKEKFNRCRIEYDKFSEYSKNFNEFIFDNFYYNILRANVSDKKEILEYINDFKKKYKGIGISIRTGNEDFWDGYSEKEIGIMKNQFLFLDLMSYRYHVEILFEELKIEDLRKLFNYFHDKHKNSLRYTYGVKEGNENTIFYQWAVIFDLSKLFLHKQIKKEHFDWLHSIYDYATKIPRVAILYNLVQGKFSLAYERIGTEYFLQGYTLLLKQIFKNFWLGTVGKDLESFKEIGKEIQNDGYGDEQIFNVDITELQNDVYPMEYVEEIFKKYNVKEPDYEDVLYSLGYKSRSGFILKDSYKSFNEYVLHRICTGNDIVFEKELVKNITIYNVLADYCREYKLFKVDDELYIPINQAEKKGLTIEYLDEFFKNLKYYFGEEKFFTIKSIKEKIDINIFNSFGFDESFLENILFYNDRIGYIKLGNHKIFTYLYKKPTMVDFIEEEMKNYNKIPVDEFAEKVSEKYGLDITYNIIIRYVLRLENVYYAKKLDTLYLNKQDLNNELYGNDGN